MTDTETTNGETPKQTRNRRGAGQYVVLFGKVDEPQKLRPVMDPDAAEPPAENADPFHGLKLFDGGQEEAKRAAIDFDSELDKLVDQKGAIVVAVPAASWRPTFARVVQRVSFGA